MSCVFVSCAVLLISVCVTVSIQSFTFCDVAVPFSLVFPCSAVRRASFLARRAFSRLLLVVSSVLASSTRTAAASVGRTPLLAFALLSPPTGPISPFLSSPAAGKGFEKRTPPGWLHHCASPRFSPPREPFTQLGCPPLMALPARVLPPLVGVGAPYEPSCGVFPPIVCSPHVLSMCCGGPQLVCLGERHCSGLLGADRIPPRKKAFARALPFTHWGLRAHKGGITN